MSCRIVRVADVEWLDEASPHHQGPQPVHDVAAEVDVLIRNHRARQLKPAAVLRHAAFLRLRFDEVRFFDPFRIGNLRQIEQPRIRHSLNRSENRSELHIALGLFAKHLLLRFRISEEVAAFEEGTDPVVVALQVAVDRRVVVALSTLQINTQKNASDVAREQVDVEVPVEIKLRCGPLCSVSTVGGEDFIDDRIPAAVFADRLSQPVPPVGIGHV